MFEANSIETRCYGEIVNILSQNQLSARMWDAIKESIDVLYHESGRRVTLPLPKSKGYANCPPFTAAQEDIHSQWMPLRNAQEKAGCCISI